MFFVGATGQLLTLILTVCLPFVLILSGPKKIEVAQPTLHFETEQNQFEFSESCTQYFSFVEDVAIETPKQKFEFGVASLLHIPPDNSGVKWKSLYSQSSGNKAPPSFQYFSC